MNAFERKTSSIFVLLISLILTGCAFGEQVGSASAVVRTSMLPASVPYYLSLCGQDAGDQQYLLIPPSGLKNWLEAKGSYPATREESATDRQACAKDRKIGNGDPITVRLHRVGIGGLSTFDTNGNCQSGCRRDIAIVIDFNGSETLQKPIVAYYQTNVLPDTNLQFTNFTIYTQNEWYYRYPPSVRVRLYDVKDDKDQALRAQLDTVAKGKGQVLAYIAGAAIAGPIIDTAIDAARRLTDGPRNRAILDMSFQLFPESQEEPGAADAQQQRQQQQQIQQQQQPPEVLSTAALTADELRQLQVKYGIKADGIWGRETQTALEKADPGLKQEKPASPAYNQRVRKLLPNAGSAPGAVKAEGSKAKGTGKDWTFGAPIYASQFIVFNEGAKPIEGCNEIWRKDSDSPRKMLGQALPKFYFVPDGVRFGGARVYGERKMQGQQNAAKCMLESPFVVFSITRESGAVAVDVAKRISDLQGKFTAQSVVSEDAVAALGATLVDAQLGLAIDRLENMRRADQLVALIATLQEEYRRHGEVQAPGSAAPPLPSASVRSRAFRLIADYTGCVLNDTVNQAYLTELLNRLKPINMALKREDAWLKPYFSGHLPADFKCPSLAAVPEQTPPPAEQPSQPPNTPPTAPDPGQLPPPAPQNPPVNPDKKDPSAGEAGQ